MKTHKKLLSVGVVGCGYWGPNLVRNFRQSPDCQLKVLCDASESRLSHMRRLYPELATTGKFEDLLQDSQLDAVVIATPLRLHYAMAKSALGAGPHVFIEQPLSRTQAQAANFMILPLQH